MRRRLHGRPGLHGLALVALVAALGVPTQAQDSPSAQLFNPDVVNRIDLQLHTADWEKLKQNFQENTYYPAAMLFNGQTVRNSGIRSRGLGSRSATKPGLRVDFDRYATGQTFLGLKSIVLDNLTQDPSAVHETVTMKLFARLGIPAPREAHVRLYVNNEYIGLYAVVESIDKSFLARVFGTIGEDTQNDGYLYEFNYVDPWTFTYLGSDLEAYKARFDAKTHESKSDAELYGPIENLVRMVNDLPASQFMSSLSEHLDLQAFVRYMAAQNFVGQNDGFLGYAGMNNFYFYRLENSSKHVFLAWDEDNAFFGPEFPIRMRHEDNVLMRKAMEVSELREHYNSVLNEAISVTQEATGPDGLTWLEFEVRRQLDLIFDALRDDPSKPYTIEAHENARNAMIIFSRDRTRSVHDQLTSASTRRPAQRQ
jgi:spore coat protein H